MARSWQYPRWRRIFMQVVMALILAGTIGLAEVVTRQRSQAGALNLTQTQILDNRLVVKLPARWSVDLSTPDTIIAREPASESGGRMLFLRLMHVRGFRSAEEFLQRSGLINGSVVVTPDDDPDGPTADDPNPAITQPIVMAGSPAVMARVLVTRGIPPSVRGRYIAVALLADKTAIVLTFESPDAGSDNSDAEAVKQLAAEMSLLRESPLDHPSTVALPTD